MDGFWGNLGSTSNASSFLLSLLVALLLFASMQVFRSQIASTAPLTIAGGFLGSLVFLSLLTVTSRTKQTHQDSFSFIQAVSNFEMNTFGPNFQARVFPEGKQRLTIVRLT